MSLAAFSPRKLHLLSVSPPRTPSRKRTLFPSDSPQSNDLGFISELVSDNSETYSPPLLSPSSSISSDKFTTSPFKSNAENILRVANHLNFNNSPRRSPRKMFGKENFDSTKSSKRSPKKSPKKNYLQKENFADKFITLLSECPENKNDSITFGIKSSDDLATPKNKTTNTDQMIQLPRSASKVELTIKPKSFYGNWVAPITTNQTKPRVQPLKSVFRPPQQSRAKAKLYFEDKPRKRERSKSADVMREAKRRKAVHTGVHHAIPRPMKRSPPKPEKSEHIREKARKVTDLSRTFYGINKRKKKEEEGWEYTLRFTKPMRYEEDLDGKRKFFKTILRHSPSSSPGSFIASPPSPAVPKKRKLLDTRKSYLSPDNKSSQELKINVSDITEMIKDQDADAFQEKPEVDDILLRLEEEEEDDNDDEEKRKEKEKQILMSILEDTPRKASMIDSLSDCTASLDLNDSQSTGCSRFILDEKENENTPRRMFSMFNKSSSSTSTPSSSGNSRKRKWRGVGENQLQIDAGQRVFGAVQCPECGMVYQVGEAEDEVQHNAFHNNLSTLRHAMWKKENVVGAFGMDYALVVTGDDPKSWQQKALDVITLVDKSLGITPDVSPNVMHNQKVFLYVSDKRIVGCMVANPISRAYKMISSESDVDICSEESYPVRCGISRMWTLFSHRRRGIASKLLDTVRRNFMYGCILSKDDIAFSIPTPDGKRFVAKYMDSPNFLVYTGY